MTLSSSGSPRSSQLRSLKSFLVNSSFHVMFGMDLPHSKKKKKNPPLGSSRRDRPTKRAVSSGGVRRPLTETQVATEILMAPVVVLRHCSVMNNLPWKENKNAYFISCLPLLLGGERKTLSEKRSNARWLTSQDERSIYSPLSIAVL
jgi:hypothetical protein